MRGYLKIYKMHEHNTVNHLHIHLLNVYVNLLLHLCGIKVIMK